MTSLQSSLCQSFQNPLLLVRFLIHHSYHSPNVLLVNRLTNRFLSTQINTSSLEIPCHQLLLIHNTNRSIANNVTNVTPILWLLLLHLAYRKKRIQSKIINQISTYYMKIFAILSALLILANSHLTYDKVILNNPQALCLDGSRGAFYLSRGDPAKVLMFFEGGGWCGDNDLPSTIQNCYSRSKSDLGSSSGYKPTQTFTEGILSDDEQNYFRTWTKVFLKYCDGSGHQGTRSQPILYKGADLYFRGQDVTIAQFAQANRLLGIFTTNVTHLVLSGESAGGLAAFHWTDYLAAKVSPSTKFWSIPDSGVFIDAPNKLTGQNSYRIWFQNLLKLSNTETGTPISACNQAYPNQLWKCMFAEHIFKFINAPLFTPQSLYDSWSLYNIIGVRCPDHQSLTECSMQDRERIQQYHRDTLYVLFEIANKPTNGVWSPVCLNHCYLSNRYYSSPNYLIPAQTGASLMQSVHQWIEGTGSTYTHIDTGDWPSNQPCAGLT